MISKTLGKIWRCAMRRKWATLLILTLLGLSITPIIILTRTYAIIHADAVPNQTMGEPVLEKQTESSTCGVHALSTIYRAYGLAPDAERIRWRLGIDTKALMWMSDSIGALHPDLFMVLAQDFFEATAADLSESAPAWEQLTQHLQAEKPALLLIRRRANGNLHWVAAAGVEGEQILIYDSLEPKPYLEGIEFAEEHLVSALLVQPSSNGSQSVSSLRALWDGTKEMKRAASRINTKGEF